MKNLSNDLQGKEPTKEQNNVLVPAIQLPQDQYAHPNAPTEWWWHVGTLITSDNRSFGFEVNACGLGENNTGKAMAYFTQIAITDVQNQKHYQKVNDIIGNALPPEWTWAETDVSKPWFVKLPGEADDSGKQTNNGAVTMKAVGNNPLHMEVTASFNDLNTNTPCVIELTLEQKGEPLLVWGTGCHEDVDPKGTSPITKNNYYYSLTHLQAIGILTIGAEKFAVTGLTWMDHEYGAFPNPGSKKTNTWTLQDVQLNNDLHLSNYTQFDVTPKEGVPMSSSVTLLSEDGKSHFIKDAITTPLNPVSLDGKQYFMRFKIQLHPHGLYIMVESLVQDQRFIDLHPKPFNNSGYEGVGKAEMRFALSETNDILLSSGTAWIEQNV